MDGISEREQRAVRNIVIAMFMACAVGLVLVLHLIFPGHHAPQPGYDYHPTQFQTQKLYGSSIPIPGLTTGG